MALSITITNAKQAPSWTTLQMFIRETIKDDNLLIIRIARPDNKVDYRGTGEYELDCRLTDDNVIGVNLYVTED